MTSTGRRNTQGTHLASVTIAALEHARVVVARHVPHAPEGVVDVLAEGGSVGTILATTDAELGGRHEVGPFVQLLQLTEGAREDKTSDGVACILQRARQ